MNCLSATLQHQGYANLKKANSSPSRTLPSKLQGRGPVPACVIERNFIKIPLVVFERRVEVQLEVRALAEGLDESTAIKEYVLIPNLHLSSAAVPLLFCSMHALFRLLSPPILA